MLLVFLLLAMSFLIGLQVFMRYVLNNSLAWSEELARYCFIWATYIGVSYGVKAKAHVAVTALVDTFSLNMQKYLRVLSYVIVGIFSYLVMKEGFALAMKIFKFGQKSSALGLPMGLIYLAPTVGFALVFVRLIQHTASDLLGTRKGN